jgi:hypothetical protein
MERKELIHYIEEPEKLEFKSLYDLMAVRDKYPYFQATYPLILKLLRSNRKFQYEIFLEKAAIQMSGREVLFDFINIDENVYKKVANQVQRDMQEERVVDLTHDELKLSKEPLQNLSELQEFYDAETNKTITGKKRDFNAWLRSTQKPKIKRNDNDRSAEKPLRSEHSSVASKTSKRVDEFIKKSPSITSPNEYEPKMNELSVKDTPSSQLMTETLAEIFVEQKKYDKAIQAYKILILNNPEKNSFFASRIEKIKQLREKH